MDDGATDAADGRPTDTLLYEVCKRQRLLRLLFMLSVATVALMVIWFPFVSPESATGVVVVMNIVGGTGFGLLSAYLLRRCARLERTIRDEIRQPDDTDD